MRGYEEQEALEVLYGRTCVQYFNAFDAVSSDTSDTIQCKLVQFKFKIAVYFSLLNDTLLCKSYLLE